MTKKEIIDIEQENYTKVILYKEGAFWVAYEHSAFLFCKYIRKLKPTKKVVHSAGGELVSIGFPNQTWAQLQPMVVFYTREPNRIVLDVNPKESCPEEVLYNFEEWKEELNLADPRAKRTVTHENLPVYKATYDLTIKVYKMSQHMQRDFRYTLGEKVKEELIDLLTAVYSANVVEEKEPYIGEARRLAEIIRVQIRLLHDLGQVAVKNQAALNADIEEIIKQLNGWHKKAIERANGVSSGG